MKLRPQNPNNSPFIGVGKSLEYEKKSAAINLQKLVRKIAKKNKIIFQPCNNTTKIYSKIY